ncbi:MAG: Flp family type IVb pilin [Promethearchaeota archaeon]
MRLKKYYKRVGQKIRQFIKDNYGGSMVEYALLVGFALFLFFIIVGVITSLLNWTIDQSAGLFDLLG